MMYTRPEPEWRKRRREILDSITYVAHARTGTVVAKGNFTTVMDTLAEKGYEPAKAQKVGNGLSVPHSKRKDPVRVEKKDG